MHADFGRASLEIMRVCGGFVRFRVRHVETLHEFPAAGQSRSKFSGGLDRHADRVVTAAKSQAGRTADPGKD
jgi:hypothetical protein